MKPKLFLLLALAVALAAGAGWLAGRRSAGAGGAGGGKGGARVEFYQDSMHPWIKSDQPGKCTICGMDLTPVMEGEKPLETGEGLITLSPSNISVADVRTTATKRQALHKTIRVAGVVTAADESRVHVSARASGEVAKLFQDNLLGQVKAGTPLAIVTTKAITELQREFIALKNFEQLEGLAGAEQDQARLLSATRARLEQFGLSAEQLAALPGRTELDTTVEVRAPIDGTVVARQVYEGMAVSEGHRMFEIVDFSTVWFKFDTYESDVAWVAAGMELEVRSPSAPGHSFKAKISYLEPSIGHMVRSLKGRAVLENPMVTESGRERRLLREREFAEGVISAEVADVLAIPRTAVLSPGAEAIVYLDKGKGTYERRSVTLGRTGDELVEVMSGLSEGELVVTRGNLLIDSQAQMNQGLPPEPPAAAEEEVLVTTVTDDQRLKASGMFGIAASMASALARDDVGQFNQQVPGLGDALLPFLQAFAEQSKLEAPLAKLEAASHLQPAANLAAARAAFLPFSNALVIVAKALRQTEDFRYLQIFHCPMVDEAVPGAAKDGYWLQVAAPLQNPFFGPAMLGCGLEVRAPAPAASPEKVGVPPAQPAPVREILTPSPAATPTATPAPNP